MIGWILVLVLLIIVYCAHLWYKTPRWRRAINMLTVASEQADATQPWRVNPEINGPPFFLQFSNFEGDNRGKVTVAMYDAGGNVIDAGFKDWEGVGDELRVGDFSILLKGRKFTYLSRKDLQNPWRGAMEAKPLPKKSVVVPK